MDNRSLDFLAGGEMGALVRTKDWSETPVGSPDTWPQSLRTAVEIVLSSRYAMFVWWGRQLTNFYNDAYRPFLGKKHPDALGQSARAVWAEIWDLIGPRAEAVLERGEATFDEALLLVMERFGYPEETYFTFSYSPIRDDDGAVGGLFCAVTEETSRIIGERRLRLLREVAASAPESQAPEEVCRAAARCIAGNPRDLPFALLYLTDPGGRTARLAAAAGADDGAGVSAEPVIDLDGGDGPWPLASARESDAPLVLDDLGARFDDLPTGAWDRPPARAVIMPLAEQGQTGVAGYLIAGLNPYLPFEEEYRGFVTLLAGQIAAGIANARAHQEERRRAEALAEIDRAKTQFFTNVSHEFRTPLTLVLGSLEDLLATRAGAGEAGEGEIATVAHRNALRLLKLVNTLLDFSRIEAGRVEASYEPTDLAPFTAELVSNFRSACDKAGLTLTVDCPPLDEPVFVDRDMWEKIVLNLVSNAFKYTHEGGIAVTLGRAGDAVALAVRDTGIGVPAHEIPRLFERFHRVAGARGRTHEGTGIGLALVQELVRLHGGSVAAASVLGEGTTVTVVVPFGTSHLPRARIKAGRSLASTALAARPYVEEALRWLPQEGEAPARPEFGIERGLLDEPVPSAGPGAGPSGRRPAILLADDNADMRDYIRRLLGPRYDVHTVGDGEAAVAALRRRPFDLLLSDVMMPRLDGFGLLRAIRDDPRLRELPVILLSARAGEEASVEGLESGANDYLVKPFGTRELLARIASSLEMAQLRRRERQAEAAARAAEERLSAARIATGTGTFRWDTRGHQVEADEALDTLFGFPAARAPRSVDEFLAVVHPDDRAGLAEAIARCGRDGGDFDREYRIVLPDGAVRWISGRGKTFRGDDGLPAYVAGTCVDITERKRVELDLRALNERLERRVTERTREIRSTSGRLFESEQRFRLLVEGVVDYAIFMLDPHGFITSWNAGAARIKGYTADEIIGQHFSRFYTDEDRRDGVPEQALATALATGKFEREGWRVRKGGERFWASVVIDAIRDERDVVIGFAKVTRDLTEKRAIEEQLRQAQKMEAIGQLTGGVAHDFNNLLQVVLGNLDALDRQIDEIGDAVTAREFRRFSAGALRGAERAVTLTQRLLAFSRRQPLDPRPTDVNKLVAGMSDLLRRTLGEAIAIETVNAGGLWRVLVDANQLENAILNLAINARDAMPEGGKLTIETANAFLDEAYAAGDDVAPGQYVMIAVSDTGQGMTKEVLAKAFEPFFTTKEVGQGTGLGLSQVYGFVKQSGGHVKIYSEPGEGVTVRIYLPRLRRAGDADEPAAASARPARGRGETILLVEDDEDVRATTGEMLRALRYRVVAAPDGAAALRLLETRADIRLVFTDVGLPGGMSGRQLADAVRAARPGLPVLFTTGYARNAIVHHGRLDPGVDLLVKPFTYAALAAKLGQMLRGPGRSP